MVTKCIICKKLKHSTLHIFNSSIPFYLLIGICLFSPRGTPDCFQYVSSTKLLCFQEVAGLEETSYEANIFIFIQQFFFSWNPFSLLYSWKCAHSIDCGMWSLLLQVLFPLWHFMTWSSHQASPMPWCILCTWSTPALFTPQRRGFLWPLDLWKSLRWYQLSFKKHISFLPEITFTLIFFPQKNPYIK